MTEIFVINLDSACERWETFLARHENLGLTFIRAPAVDGREESFGPYEAFYDPQQSMQAKAEELRPGQLGCFASHYQLWQYCAEQDEPIIVLEDDVFLDRHLFLHFLEHIDRIPSEVECLRLFPNMKKPSKYRAMSVHQLSDEMQILKYTAGPMSAMGYFLRPSAARRFLQSSQVWFLPVDIMMDRFWVHGVESYGIHPPAVTHDYGFDSIIGYPPRPPRGLVDRLNRERFALRERAMRFIANLRFWLRFRLLKQL